MADWLDGPRLVRWAKEEGVWDDTLEVAHPSFVRRLREWEKPGTLANVYTVDGHLTKIGRHLSEIPDECYTDREPNKKGTDKRLTHEQRKALVADLDAGERPQILAQRYGVASRSVNYYRGKRGDPWRQH